MSEKLEACPFCGEPMEVREESFPPPKKGKHNYYYPTCTGSDCPGIVAEQDEQGGTVCSFFTEEEAIVAANRRTPDYRALALQAGKALAGIKRMLGPDSPYSVCRTDGKVLDLGDQIVGIGDVFEGADAALAALKEAGLEVEQ